MKICRIKEIVNVGTFAEFTQGASLGFEDMTFIYGMNARGKSTLTDIFRSCQLNNSNIINERETIPNQTNQQKIIFTIKKSDEDCEKEIKFENNSWGSNELLNNVEIFGTEFIHNNLFTGLTIARENKENFTQFILGEQAVKLAGEIGKRNKQLNEKKKLLKERVPQFVNGKAEGEIKEFVDFSIDGLDKKKIKAELLKVSIDLKSEQGRLAEPQKVLQLKIPDKFIYNKTDLVGKLKRINSFLGKDYEQIQKDVLEKFNKHIVNNFVKNDGAESWISDGVAYCQDIADADCPFCGQPLNGAQELINLYVAYFDEAYKAHIKDVTEGIQEELDAVEEITFSQETVLQSLLTSIEKYNDLTKEKLFKKNVTKLQEVIDLLAEASLNKTIINIIKVVKTRYNKKLKDSYKKIDTVDCGALEKLLNTYEALLAKAKVTVETLSSNIEVIRARYENVNDIQRLVNDLATKASTLKYKEERIEQNQVCIAFKNLQQEITNTKCDISAMQTSLQTDQAEYLDRYFVAINKFFRLLGSDNFALEKDVSKQGNLPVCYLKVTFHGRQIPNSKLGFVFSESDRRALALSVFLAKISLKTLEDKAKMIVIFDDPIVSFDDNRVTNSINLFKKIQGKVSQIVVLTHYPHFIKRFCEITKASKIRCKYLEIGKNNITSLLKETNRSKFLIGEYEREFIHIYEFINRIHDNCIKAKLRPFLEFLYLPIFFAKEIHDGNVDCSSLENMIDGIFANKEEVRAKFHNFRDTLNPDSHIITSTNIEDVRGFTKDMFEYLYVNSCFPGELG